MCGCAEGLIYIRGVNNQYVTNAALLTSIYSDYLTAAGQTVTCGSATVQSPALMAFAKSQVRPGSIPCLIAVHMSYRRHIVVP